MITKERLEQLIEQGATIWVIMKSRIFERELKHKTFTYELLSVLVSHFAVPKERWYYINLFETEDEAREYLEFGNITRTERLELPSWKQVQEGFYYKGSVLIYEDDMNLCFISTSKDIVLKNYASLKNQTKFKKPLTRENYNEARRLCVKLFKGENV